MAPAASAPSDSYASEPPAPRPKKRNQVARACDWCRVHRIKCDSGFPCLNCRRRGGQCSNDRQIKSSTLPQAYREIERLKQRVEELELQLQSERQDRASPRHLDTPSTPADDSPANTGPEFGDCRAKRVWEGINISTARSPHETWYGPSSLFYFIGRINAFLTSALKETHSTQGMLPQSASSLLDGPTGSVGEDQANRAILPTGPDPLRDVESLSPIQEEYFLDMFWDTYYPLFPILDELEFKSHYQSLWVTSEKERKPSALVDIVLAVCMQYGMAQLPGARKGLAPAARGNLSDTDSSIAGRWHYRRCLTLLSAELESPTISTLQCHMLCALYLCYGSFQNMADNASGLAVRTAFMLGLHLDPPENMPQRERELRRRLWWCLYVLESNRSMKLGRPFLLRESTATCNLPGDDREIAMLSGSGFSPIGENVTWLSWNFQNTRLILASRRAYTLIYEKPADAFAISDISPIKSVMDAWLKDVPEALKTNREAGGVPFSTDRSRLEIEPFTPIWLQRQRLLLELMYHNLCTSLYRPAICFTLVGAPTMIMEQGALKCAAHAMALTHITYQILSSTSILSGWHEAFQWQWNAAMTLIGFVLAFPQSAATQVARGTIDLSVAVFEMFGNSFAVAANAATIMHDLSEKVDQLLRRSVDKNVPTIAQRVNAPEQVQAAPAPYDNPGYGILLNDESIPSQFMEYPWNFGDGRTAEIGGLLGHSIDISAETFADFDLPGTSNGFLDQWALM